MAQRSTVRWGVWNGRVAPVAVLGLAVLVGLTIWLALESRGASTAGVRATGPVTLSEPELKSLAGRLGQPVYWVGHRPGTMYEVTEESDGVHLRYLPRGAEVGDPRPLLTVATYPVAKAFEVTSGLRGVGTNVTPLPGGAISAVSSSRPNSAYVAFPGIPYQVEVYDPDPAAVSGLARRVEVVRPSGSTAAARGPEAVSEEDLLSLAASLDHPVYWLGPREDFTYELTQTSDGTTYIRYLPQGVPVGSRQQAYVTVVTYRMENAFEATRRAGEAPDALTVHVPGGGIATWGKGSPTNVHVAFPGANAQAEVFDQSPDVPSRLVSSGALVPIG